MVLARWLIALLAVLAGHSAQADVLSSPTIVGILTTPAATVYTSIEADATSGGSKMTGPWSFSGAAMFDSTIDVTGAATFDSTIDVTGAAAFDSTIHVVGASMFDEAVTAPHFNTTDPTGLQLGGNASIGLFNDATHLSLRVPNASGVLSVQSPSAAAFVPVKALNFQSQEAGTPRFGGTASYGVHTDGTHIAVRTGVGGSFYFQPSNGAVTRAIFGASGHYTMGATPGIAPGACGGVGGGVAGTDVDGGVFVGPATASCVVSFGVAFAAAPQCTVTSRNGVAYTYVTSTTGITISGAGIASTSFDWHCGGL